MNLSEITQIIKDYLHRDDLDLYINEFIRNAESELNSLVKASQNEVLLSVTSGTPLPDDYNHIIEIDDSDWSIENGTIYADGQMRYSKKLDLITDTTNWLSEKYPEAYIFGALKYAAIFMRDDERIMLWETMFKNVIDRINTIEFLRKRFGTLQLNDIVRLTKEVKL